MYRILIRYNAEHNLWKLHGTDVRSSSACKGPDESFEEFGTDDKEELKAELLKLDEKFGSENIRAYRDVTAAFSVEVSDPDGE